MSKARSFARHLSLALLTTAGALVAPREATASDHEHAAPAETVQRQRHLVTQGEERLAAGDAEGAQRAFEGAAEIVHAADAELGLVRSYMQAGAYRQALSFGSHAAGAHREMPAGMALYAWLLSLGGQQPVALRMLDEWIARMPNDSVLQQARAQLSTDTPRAQGLLLALPWRMAPQDGTSMVTPVAATRSSGLLSADGRHAWVPTSAVEGSTHVWVRNGLGQTRAARIVEMASGLSVVMLELAEALPAPAHQAWRSSPPFAGAPNYLVEFVESNSADPAWPLLRQGFFGRFTDPLQPRALGIDVPSGRHGGPVLDRLGQIAGIAVQAADGTAKMLPIAMLAQRWPERFVEHRASATTGPVAMDALYESALSFVVQVIVER